VAKVNPKVKAGKEAVAKEKTGTDVVKAGNKKVKAGNKNTINHKTPNRNHGGKNAARAKAGKIRKEIAV